MANYWHQRRGQRLEPKWLLAPTLRTPTNYADSEARGIFCFQRGGHTGQDCYIVSRTDNPRPQPRLHLYMRGCTPISSGCPILAPATVMLEVKASVLSRAQSGPRVAAVVTKAPTRAAVASRAALAPYFVTAPPRVVAPRATVVAVAPRVAVAGWRPCQR